MNNIIKICIFGDVCPLYGFYKREIYNTNIFNSFINIIKKSDYCICNLESPITSNEKKFLKNSIFIKSKFEDLQVIHNSGINAVSLANNHILDYGEQGLRDTFKAAKSLNINTYGAGTIDEAQQSHIVNINDKKIAFLAFAEEEFNCAEENRIGANRWDDLDSPDLIRKIKSECDVLIIQYHGGIEHYIYPSPLLQKRCRKMADCGADFVTCQHSHCIGTREKWNNCEILYGQGNSFFGYQKYNSMWNNGLIVNLLINEKDIQINYTPIEATESGEYLMSEDSSSRILHEMENNSKLINN